jgi:hypothetical protein
LNGTDFKGTTSQNTQVVFRLQNVVKKICHKTNIFTIS